MRSDYNERKSHRYKHYDYSQPGYYFITICALQHLCVLGTIKMGEIELNDVGQNVIDCWKKIPNFHPQTKLHEFIVMPNHVHGIIEIISPSKVTDSPNKLVFNPDKTPFESPRNTIGSMVRGFKTGVTQWVRQNTDMYNIWQRDYHDHIIRDANELNKIKHYIINNPKQWEYDKFFR